MIAVSSKRRVGVSISVVFAALFLSLTAHAEPLPATGTVQVGAARVDITPEHPVRMYGYASRKTESEGVAGRLMAKALVIGSDEDGPAVLLCVDNGSVPQDVRQAVFEHVAGKIPLKPERFVLSNSHCHSGPDLKGIFGIDPGRREHIEHLDRYRRELTAKLQTVVLDAAAARVPGRLDWTQGKVTFAANRRVLKEGKWAGFGAVPDGPVDHSLPLLRVTDEEGRVLAVVVNYACHCTTLRGNFRQIHGDWAACAQEYIEEAAPGVVAMVTIGCGADSDPCPHSTVELCEQHGRELADEVARLLAGPMQTVEPMLTCRSASLEIPFLEPPPVDALREPAKKSWALQKVLEDLEQGKKPAPRRYPLTIWSFGDSLAMVFLSNEVVVDYALRLKRELDPQRLWITAYADDVSTYIVSQRILEEGGYEARNSLSTVISYGRPDQVEPAMEDRIVEAVRSLLPEGFRSRKE